MPVQPIHMTFDLSKEPHQHDVVNIRQGEVNAVVIEAEILDGEVEVDLSPYDVYFECRHASGKMHQDNDSLTVSGNVITYTVHEKVGAVPGRIKTAYFSLVIATENGTRELYATTEDFEVRVLPNACQEDAGIAEAYSSEIEEMLQYCYDTFTENEAGRQETFEANEETRFARTQEAIDAANEATDRANEAADTVQEAIEGNLDPLFKAWIDSQKDVPGGLASYELFVSWVSEFNGSFLTNEEFLSEVID